LSPKTSEETTLSLGERVASRVRGYFVGLAPRRRASDSSPGPRRLMKTPDAVHPLPWGEGGHVTGEGGDPISILLFQIRGRGVLAAVLLRVCVGLCGLFLFGCRLDMHVQPKYKPLDPSNFFDDGRSARPEVPGTVAHGHLRTDELLYTGKLNGQPADAFPFPSRARSSSVAASVTTFTARLVMITPAVEEGWWCREVFRLRLLITLNDS